MNEKEREVAKILEESGFRNISTDLIREFLNTLPNDDSSSDEFYVTGVTKEVKTYDNSKKSSPSKISTRLPEPVIINSPPRETSKKRFSQNKLEDEELKQWQQKMSLFENKAVDLDKKLEECRSVILHPPKKCEDIDTPLYYGSSERKLDPYPAVKSHLNGGFIRPPPIKSKRKKTVCGSNRGGRLLYEERFPDYVPPTELRRDQYRWEVRQKLIYSGPEYH